MAATQPRHGRRGPRAKRRRRSREAAAAAKRRPRSAAVFEARPGLKFYSFTNFESR
jgi:hypothetical protein